MKKVVIYFLMMLAIVGCGTKENNNSGNSQADLTKYEISKVVDEVTSEDFIYRLVTEKAEYTSEEKVVLYAELEYIGEAEEITIYHAASPFHFPMVEKTREYEIGYGMEQPLIQRTLKKGEPIREEYKSSGGFSEQDSQEYIKFMQEFWEKGFPKGYYIVEGYADFFIEEPINKNYHIKATVDFKVN